MKRYTYVVFSIVFILCGFHSALGQDAFRSDDGWGINWNTNAYGTDFPSWGGTTWDYVNTLATPADRHFRFYTDNFGTCGTEWGPAGDLEMFPGIPITLTPVTSGAYFIDVQNNTYHYIFRTRSSAECTTPEAVYFEIQGAVQSISSVTQSPSAVFPGQDVVVTANLSGTNNTGQGYYLRYTTDGFGTSSVLEMTGGGTAFTASIPGTANTPGANLEYYVFSSGAGLTIAPVDADFFTISLNGNYNYTVALEWVSTANGDWETASSWTANDIPPAAQPIRIANGHSVTTSSSSNIDFSSLTINGGGSLVLGANSTAKLTAFNGIIVDGTLAAGLNSTMQAPFGGYLNGTGSVQFHDFEIGEDTGTGNQYFYLNQNIELTHDLRIEDNGGLHPGDGSHVELEMSGVSGNVYNDGQLDCTPDLNDYNNERLDFLFSGGSTVLRANGGLGGDRTKFSNITINLGASLVADAAGVLNAELQFGSLINNGSFNMGQTATGRVNFTLRGEAGNDYSLYSDNTNQAFQFSDLIIGNHNGNDGGHLYLETGSEDIELRISGDFQNYNRFSHANTDPATIDVVMNGTVDQNIVGQTGQTSGNQTNFGNLEIANAGGDVYLATIGPDLDPDNNISYEIEGGLTLTSGKLISLSGGNRHHLTLGENATVNASGAQSDESGLPCYIEGPLRKRAGNGSISLDFPVGQGGDFRNLNITTTVSSGPALIKVEHFSYSANFTGMSVQPPLVNVSDVRFWNLEVDDPNKVSNSMITIEYGDADTDGVTLEADLRVAWAEQDASIDADPTNDEWTKSGNVGGAANSVTSEIFDFSTLGDKIDITLGNVNANVNPLPVTWLSFTCTEQYETNLLRWSTSSEINSDYFVLERAASDLEFKEISRSVAQGWSNKKTDYYFIDQSPLNGQSYYRLKQVDFDGVFEYSDIVSTYSAVDNSVYPNPFSDFLIIANDSNTGGAYEMSTGLGSVVISGPMHEAVNKISTAKLVNGVYIIRLTDKTGDQSVFKVIKHD